jgi:CHAT domain-containing protein/tetratricopeptide (TPR) repeat protein
MRTFLCSVALLLAGRDSYTLSNSTQITSTLQNPEALEQGTVIEREFAKGDEHRYRIALSLGEYVSVIVEQRGIDVGVQVLGPDDTVLTSFYDELTSRGAEHVEVVADTSGTYTLRVKPGVSVVKPGAYAIRIAARRAATDDDRSMEVSRRLRATALRLRSEAKVTDARTILERALSIAEGVRGGDDPDVGVLIFELAGNAMATREDARAEALYQRAIGIFEKNWGDQHPYAAMARSRVASLYERAGQGPKGEALLRQALDVLEKTLGTDHLWYVQSLTTLGILRYDAGDLDKSEEISRRAMTLMEKIEDTHSIEYGALLNNLGEIYRQRQDGVRAKELYQRSLALAKELQGEDSFLVSTNYQNLGILAREHKDYPEAEEYYTRALSIRERLLGPEHPDIAPLLNNLAIVQHLTGRDERALETNFRTLDIWVKTRGPYHRGTLLSVGNIARLYAAIGDIPKAIDFQRRADSIIETQLQLNLAVGSERQKLAFVSNVVAERTDRTISLNLHEAPKDPEASALAALVLLQRKGRVLDAMTDTFAALRQRVMNPRDRKLLDELNATTAQLAQLALSPPVGTPAAENRARIQRLEAQKERLEVELGDHSTELRARLQPVTLEAVRSAIPGDAALLEFVVFRPFDPKAERNAEAYGAPHYAAYVLRREGAPTGVDLGPATVIDEATDAMRAALRDPSRSDFQRRARTLDERVMRPLRESIGDATRLLISADGALSLVPFEALVNEQGRYLIERFAMSYLTSGRDLLRMQVARLPRTEPVIVADPVFGEPASASGERAIRKPVVLRTQTRSITTGEDPSTMYFAPLGATAEEARAIKALFPDARLFTGVRATKAAIQQLEAPRMLHIASHGFFLQDAAGDPVPVATAGSAPPTRGVSANTKVENPLLRSGLALAGANLNHDRARDGILTALEASGLNLWGTKLVTLSACDTGVGEVRNGEGVYGLRRAFVLAGAETLVMSLWPVSDYIGREMMVRYYTALRAGLGRGDALRQAKLEMLKRKGRQHPFYWASFIQSGEWASLDDQR